MRVGGGGFTSNITPLNRTQWKASPIPLWVRALMTLHCACRSPETRPSSGMCWLSSKQPPLFTATGRESKTQERRPPRQRLLGASLMLFSLLERSLCVARPHGIPLAGESPPHAEALPVPQMACCQLSDAHRNWSVFLKLMDIRTQRHVREISE